MLAPVIANCLDDPVAHNAHALTVLRRPGHCEEQAIEYLAGHRERLNRTEKLELARGARKLGRWDLAMEVWTELADADSPDAMLALAKHLEHRQHDLQQAHGWTRRLQCAQPDELAHRHRLARLNAKIKRLTAQQDTRKTWVQN